MNTLHAISHKQNLDQPLEKDNSLHNNGRLQVRQTSIAAADGAALLVVGCLTSDLAHGTTSTKKGTTKIFHSMAALLRDGITSTDSSASLHQDNQCIYANEGRSGAVQSALPYGTVRRNPDIVTLIVDFDFRWRRRENAAKDNIANDQNQDTLKGHTPLISGSRIGKHIQLEPSQDLCHEDLGKAQRVQETGMTNAKLATVKEAILPMTQCITASPSEGSCL
jgi:hypothetical protein